MHRPCQIDAFSTSPVCCSLDAQTLIRDIHGFQRCVKKTPGSIHTSIFVQLAHSSHLHVCCCTTVCVAEIRLSSRIATWSIQIGIIPPKSAIFMRNSDAETIECGIINPIPHKIKWACLKIWYRIILPVRLLVGGITIFKPIGQFKV